MRILFWTDGFWPRFGGLEVFSANLVRALRKRGHDCEVITNRNEAGPSYSFGDVAVHPFSFQDVIEHGGLKAVAGQCAQCNRIVDRFQPDVIHLHGISRSVFQFTRQQKRARRPAVITLHDNLAAREKRTMAAWALENTERVIAVSDYIYHEALGREPGLAGRLRTILNALPEPETCAAPLPSRPRILAAGRLATQKGFDLAINAFARVAAEFPDATLTLAGDGENRGDLEDLATASSFGARIRFTGWLEPEKMPELFNEHSLILVPSRWQEPFGLVALEAAQFGRPVIASRMGGLPEIVIDGVTGKLFENEDIPALADTLRSLLADPALAARMGREARARASASFPFNRLVDQYEEVYRQVCDAKV